MRSHWALGLFGLAVVAAGVAGAGDAPPAPSLELLTRVPRAPEFVPVGLRPGRPAEAVVLPPVMSQPLSFEPEVELCIDCPDPAVGRAVKAEAEFQIREQARHFAPYSPRGVASKLALGWSPSDATPLAEYLQGGVPTAVCRAMLESRLPNAYPWCRYGLPEVLYATPARRKSLDEACRAELAAGKAYNLRTLLARGSFLEAERPVAQSASLVAFLATLRKSDEMLARLARADAAGQKPGADPANAVSNEWQFTDAAALQAAWVAWLHTPGSRHDSMPFVNPPTVMLENPKNKSSLGPERMPPTKTLEEPVFSVSMGWAVGS